MYNSSTNILIYWLSDYYERNASEITIFLGNVTILSCSVHTCLNGPFNSLLTENSSVSQFSSVSQDSIKSTSALHREPSPTGERTFKSTEVLHPRRVTHGACTHI